MSEASDRADLPSLNAWVDALPALGRYTFTSVQADRAVAASTGSRRRALARLIAQQRLISPRRGFYVIVPPEYRQNAAVPPTSYLDDMMAHLATPYYVGLLSAAALYGAGHQQPQRLQVVTARRLRPTAAEARRIAWVTKHTVAQTPVEQRTVATGYLTVSTREATACDLVQYATRAGGFGNVATVLAELAVSLDPHQLQRAADAADGVAVIQRMGYLLEHVVMLRDATAMNALEDWLQRQTVRPVPLRHHQSIRGAVLAPRWGVLVNDRVERDITMSNANDPFAQPGSEHAPEAWDTWLDGAGGEVETEPHTSPPPPNLRVNEHAQGAADDTTP